MPSFEQIAKARFARDLDKQDSQIRTNRNLLPERSAIPDKLLAARTFPNKKSIFRYVTSQTGLTGRSLGLSKTSGKKGI